MGIVYIIECNITGEVYIGSTMLSLEERYKKHRRSNRSSARGIIDRGNHMVRALEVVDTEDRDQLRIREQYWMNQYECVNQIKAYTTQEERKEKQKENWEIYTKKYPDLQRKRNCLYYQENKDKEKARIKIYRENNREKIKQMRQRYNTQRSEWEATWKLDGRKIDATNLLDIDPTLFE